MLVVDARGAQIPCIGLGTMTLRGDVCVNAVQEALRLGYRHLDTAGGYLNEREVGEGLRASGLRCEDVFVTTKVPVTELQPGNFERSVENSLRALGLSSVDLLLIHWPSLQVPLSQSIKLLCDAKRKGQAKQIGVSNFPLALLEQAVKLATEPLAVNQIEVHPFIDQTKMLAACKAHGIVVIAYAPVARGKASNNDVLGGIAGRHGKSSVQVMLRYLIELGLAAIPNTAKPEHMKANLEIFDFCLSNDEMAELKKLNAANMRLVNPAHAPTWDT